MSVKAPEVIKENTNNYQAILKSTAKGFAKAEHEHAVAAAFAEKNNGIDF